jgi:hypothetical protein
MEASLEVVQKYVTINIWGIWQRKKENESNGVAWAKRKENGGGGEQRKRV